MGIEEGHDVTSGGTTSAPEGIQAQAKEQALHTTDQLKTTATSRVRDTLDTRSTQLADQITPYAEGFRRASHHLEAQGSTSGGRAVGRLAEQVQQVSNYLRRSDADRFLGDVENFARERPWAAGGIGVALGFMGARFLKASSETRYSSRYPAAEHPLAADVPPRDMPLSRETNEPTVGGW